MMTPLNWEKSVYYMKSAGWRLRRTWVWIQLHLLWALWLRTLSYCSCQMGMCPLYQRETRRVPLGHWTRCCVHRTCPRQSLCEVLVVGCTTKPYIPYSSRGLAGQDLAIGMANSFPNILFLVKLSFQKQFMVFHVSQTTEFLVHHIYSFPRSVLFYVCKVFQEK